MDPVAIMIGEEVLLPPILPPFVIVDRVAEVRGGVNRLYSPAQIFCFGCLFVVDDDAGGKKSYDC